MKIIHVAEVPSSYKRSQEHGMPIVDSTKKERESTIDQTEPSKPAKQRKTSAIVDCPLKGRVPVLPEISQQTDILFIGWNPGADEIKARRPFVGASGKLLRQWIKRIGITNRSGFANVCLYRPPEGNRKPSKPEIIGCAGVLTKLIDRLQPKLIICLGDVPARQFGFKGSVGQMVGRFKSDGDTLITVLYHPAYAVRLKGSKRFSEIESQTIEILQESLYRIGGERKVDSYPYTFVPVVALFGNEVVAIDTEHIGIPDARLCELDRKSVV